ncbi:MAG: SDR family oxidoreductase [Candidatus Competibacterales bacterium]
MPTPNTVEDPCLSPDRQPPILITGAAQRLGLHCALALAREGFAVIATYRTLRPGVKTLMEAGVTTLPADFSQPEGIEQFIERLTETTDTLRAVVHNAALWLDDATLEADLDAFQRTMAVNVLAPYLITTRCLPLLQKSPGALRDVVHITDANISRGKAQKSLYLASKAALESLTRSLAQRLAPAIKVNAVALGLIAVRDHIPPERRTAMLNRCALGIDPGPEVLHQTLRYILDNPFLTGAVLPLDGGRNVV